MGLVTSFLEAANYTAGRPGGPPRAWVVHDEEFPEGSDSAEKVAAFFHGQLKNPASDSRVSNPPAKSGGSSAHYCIDSNSIVQCVRDADTAWDAPPNTEYPHLGAEHDGFAHQTRAQWLDGHGKKMLRLSARLAAKKSAQFGIPVKKLSVADVKAKKKGFCGHRDISDAFGFTSHTDPGSSFPWDWYLTRVRRYRWVYVQYSVLNAAGKVVARSGVVRGSNKKAFQRFLSKSADKIKTSLTAKIKRDRRF